MSKISDLQADYKGAAEFLGGLPLEAINVTALAPNHDKPIVSHSFMRNAAGIAGCVKFLEKYGAEGRNLYFNCNDLSVRLRKSKRKNLRGEVTLAYKANEGEVPRVNMPFADMDPPDGTTQANLPAARAAMLARAQAHNPPPTFVINSGNGLGCFWILTKSVQVTPANLLMLKGINKKLVDDLDGDPHCVDLCHVMRIPFTINWPNATKRQAGRVPALSSVVYDERGLDEYSIDQFTSATVEAKPGAAVTSGNEYEQINEPEIPDMVDLSKLPPELQARIVKGTAEGFDRSNAAYHVGCDLRRAGWSDGAILHVLTNPDYKISDHFFDNRQREPHVQASRVILDMNAKGIKSVAQEFDVDERANAIRRILLMLKMTAENGAQPGDAANAEQLIFELSQKFNITPEEIAAAQAGAQAGATSGPDVADVHQPITPNVTWESLLRDYVYVGQQGQFVRRADGEMWNADKFEKQFHSTRHWINPAGSRKKLPTSVTQEIFDLGPNGMETFDTFCFRPGKPERFNGAFNQWRPSQFKPVEGDTSLWDAHLEYLLTEERSRNLVLDWCAWVLQNPDDHPNYAIAMIGLIQGTGKTVVPTVLAKLLSAAAVTRIDERTLMAAHETWPLRTKLAIIEIREASKALSSRLFHMITAPGIHVDIKGANDFDIWNVLAAWVESNKPDAIKDMDDSDRRFEVHNVDKGRPSPLLPQPDAYYDKLYDEMLNDPAAMNAIMWQLQHRPVSKEYGKHRAHDTAGKEEMQEATRSPLKQWMIDEKDDALRWHVLTVDDIRLIVPAHINGPYRNRGGIEQDITAVLKGKPFYGEKLGQFRLGGKDGGRRAWLWYAHRTPTFYSMKCSDGKYRVGKPPAPGEPDTRTIVVARTIVRFYLNEHRLDEHGNGSDQAGDSLEDVRAEFGVG